MKTIVSLFQKFISRPPILIVSFIFFYPYVYIFPQDVSIELKIVWDSNDVKLPEKYFSVSNKSLVPYLNISYTNNTCSNIYFLKLINNRNNKPKITTIVMAEPFNIDSIFFYFPKYSSHSNRYYVCIDGRENFGGSWNISSDSFTISQGIVSTRDYFFADHISDFYEAIRTQEDSDSDSLNPFGNFRVRDVTASAILENKNEDFIFLRKGESYSENFNLIGFYLMGGHYYFKLCNSSFTDYVMVETNERMGFTEKMLLPNRIGDFQLYSGECSSNGIEGLFQRSKIK